MLYWIRFPLIRFLIFFIAGILLSRIIDFNTVLFILLFYALTFFYFILLIILNKENFIRYNFLLGIIAFSILTLSGAIISSGHNQLGDPDQLVNANKKIEGYLVKIEEVDKDDSLYTKLTVKVHLARLNHLWEVKSGKILLILRNSPDEETSFQPGNLLLVRGAPSAFKGPENPNQFDYRKYMFYKGIYLQHFLDRNQYTMINAGSKINMMTLAGNLRNRCRLILSRHIQDDESLGLVSALTLGMREELSDEMTEDYARAGISHILAVSGLHVGIFYIILFVLFKPFNRNKVSAWIISGIIVSILIIFAFVTGLSPSVLRSVILFTFIESGRRLGRKSISFNTLAASALFLLIITTVQRYTLGYFFFRPISAMACATSAGGVL